jgi:hypothetical protein
MVSSWWQATDTQIPAFEADPSGLDELLESDGEGFYLDKAWHGIHFLLTGTAYGGDGPLASILFGRSLGDAVERDGAIASHALTSADVRAFDDALSTITIEEFAGRFDARAMMKAEIYPDFWDEEDEENEEDVLEYLVEYYEKLRGGVRAARDKGLGLITYAG